MIILTIHMIILTSSSISICSTSSWAERATSKQSSTTWFWIFEILQILVLNIGGKPLFGGVQILCSVILIPPHWWPLFPQLYIWSPMRAPLVFLVPQVSCARTIERVWSKIFGQSLKHIYKSPRKLSKFCLSCTVNLRLASCAWTKNTVFKAQKATVIAITAGAKTTPINSKG